MTLLGPAVGDGRGGSVALRILAVLAGTCDDTPTSGARMRRHHALQGLLGAGAVEVLITKGVPDDEVARMESCYGIRPTVLAEPEAPRRAARRWWLPRRLRRRDPAVIKAQLRRYGASPGCVFVERLDDLLLLGSEVAAPVVLDMDDLDSQVIAQQRGLLWRNAIDSRSSRRLRSVPPRARRGLLVAARVPTTAARYVRLTVELRRWRGAERRARALSAVVLACSDADARSLGSHPNVVVIPNGFDLVGAPAGGPEPRDPPTVAFWGSFDYAPNRDGARWFVASILPTIRQEIPELHVLFAGRGSEPLGALGPGIEAAGFVDDLAPHLARTDVAIVPLRLGGGTRIKIVEAWANRIPVVSTTVGAHGLDAVDGRDLLVADRPDAFADAVLRLVRERPLRQRLVDGASHRASELRWQPIERRLTEAVITASESA